MRELRPAPGPPDPLPNSHCRLSKIHNTAQEESPSNNLTGQLGLGLQSNIAPHNYMHSPLPPPPQSHPPTSLTMHQLPSEGALFHDHSFRYSSRVPNRPEDSSTPIQQQRPQLRQTPNSSRTTTQALPRHARTHMHDGEDSCTHIVQFYSSPSHLYNTITSYLLTSFFSDREAAIVLATAQHISALEHQLFHQYCLFPEVMKRRGQLVMLEANEILSLLLPSQLFPGGSSEGAENNNRTADEGRRDQQLTQEKFENFIRPLVEGLHSKGFEKVLVYGELVNVLCERGQHMLALELEGMWNCFLRGTVAKKCDVQLLCGYQVEVFDTPAPGITGDTSGSSCEMTDTREFAPNRGVGESPEEVKSSRLKEEEAEIAFREICRSHSIVRLTERYGSAVGAGRNISEIPPVANGSGTNKLAGNTSSVNVAFTGEQGAVVALLEQKLRQCEKIVEIAREKERNLRKVFDSLPVGVRAVHLPEAAGSDGERNKASEVTNSTWWSMLGLHNMPENMEEMDLRAWAEKWVHEEDKSRFIHRFAQRNVVPDCQKSSKFTYRVIRADGTVRNLLCQTRFLEDSKSDYIDTVTDLTDVISTLGNVKIDEPGADRCPTLCESMKSAVTSDRNQSTVSSNIHSNTKRRAHSISSSSPSHEILETLRNSQTSPTRRQSISGCLSPLSGMEIDVGDHSKRHKRKSSDASLERSPERGDSGNRHKHWCGSNAGVQNFISASHDLESELAVDAATENMEFEKAEGGHQTCLESEKEISKSLNHPLIGYLQDTFLTEQKKTITKNHLQVSNLPSPSGSLPGTSNKTSTISSDMRATKSNLMQPSAVISDLIHSPGILPSMTMSSSTRSMTPLSSNIVQPAMQSSLNSDAYQYAHYQSQLQQEGQGIRSNMSKRELEEKEMPLKRYKEPRKEHQETAEWHQPHQNNLASSSSRHSIGSKHTNHACLEYPPHITHPQPLQYYQEMRQHVPHTSTRFPESSYKHPTQQVPPPSQSSYYLPDPEEGSRQPVQSSRDRSYSEHLQPRFQRPPPE